jgi:large subunit ribosomal protein L18
MKKFFFVIFFFTLILFVSRSILYFEIEPTGDFSFFIWWIDGILNSDHILPLKQNNYNQLCRFSIFRSCKNMSVQIINDKEGKTVVSVSSLEKDIKANKNIKGYNVAGAYELGKIIGKRALDKKINNVIFDIGAYKYHGKVAAIIEGAKSIGLNSTETETINVKKSESKKGK